MTDLVDPSPVYSQVPESPGLIMFEVNVREKPLHFDSVRVITQTTKS